LSLLKLLKLSKYYFIKLYSKLLYLLYMYIYKISHNSGFISCRQMKMDKKILYHFLVIFTIINNLYRFLEIFTIINKDPQKHRKISNAFINCYLIIAKIAKWQKTFPFSLMLYLPTRSDPRFMKHSVRACLCVCKI